MCSTGSRSNTFVKSICQTKSEFICVLSIFKLCCYENVSNNWKKRESNIIISPHEIHPQILHSLHSVNFNLRASIISSISKHINMYIYIMRLLPDHTCLHIQFNLCQNRNKKGSYHDCIKNWCMCPSLGNAGRGFQILEIFWCCHCCYNAGKAHVCWERFPFLGLFVVFNMRHQTKTS